MRIKIRSAKLADKDTVINLFYQMLQHAKENNVQMDFLPTYQNAVTLWDEQFESAITATDPILLAVKAHREDLVVGGIFWVEVKSRLTLHERYATGWGTFVLKPFRRKGVGTQLREAAIERCRRRNIKSVRGIITHGNHTHMASHLAPYMEHVGICVKINIH